MVSMVLLCTFIHGITVYIHIRYYCEIFSSNSNITVQFARVKRIKQIPQHSHALEAGQVHGAESITGYIHIRYYCEIFSSNSSIKNARVKRIKQIPQHSHVFESGKVPFRPFFFFFFLSLLTNLLE